LILLKKLRKLRIGVAGESNGRTQRRRAGEKSPNNSVVRDHQHAALVVTLARGEQPEAAFQRSKALIEVRIRASRFGCRRKSGSGLAG
jgi:hypothetical protein